MKTTFGKVYSTGEEKCIDIFVDGYEVAVGQYPLDGSEWYVYLPSSSNDMVDVTACSLADFKREVIEHLRVNDGVGL